MTTEQNTRTIVPLLQGWRFFLGDVADAIENDFDDSKWRVVDVPHDWSVESSFSEDLEGATGYLPGGIGWYRKTFQSLGTETSYLHFDGVYNNAIVYLNGERLGEHPYGYSPFYYDISDNVRPGENVIAVRVDHSRYCDSRWYTGSGIYREVELIGAARTHIPVWGTFVTTPEVTAESASIQLELSVLNSVEGGEVRTVIHGPSGTAVAECTSQQSDQIVQTIQVASPELWDIDSPKLYQAETQLILGGKVVDVYHTTFGIRTFHFDSKTGFFLNGRRVPIKGVCLHHDGGCVGAAVPDDVWRRRFEKLKVAGVNAVRISHNPGSEAFLRLCDEMGLLVQDEFFDEWDNPKDKRKNMNEEGVDYITRGYTEHFQEWAERDLKNVMYAHRNHPSIFQWSIGNEIEWTYPRNAEATGFFNADWTGNYFWQQPPHSIDEIKRLLDELPRGEYDIGETAQKLSKWVKEVDQTRPVIANCILPSSSYQSGYADALDVIGFSYRRVIYDYGFEHFPDLPIMGTENVAQWHEWKAIEERPFVAGTFLWTGIDYLGESNGLWPKRSNDSGMLDTAGFEEPSYHMMKTLWSDEPHVHLTTQLLEKSPYTYDDGTGFIGEDDPEAWQKKVWIWHDVNTHWNYSEGELIAVEVYSNLHEIELFLNGESLGIKKLSDFDDRIFKWAVPFVEGTLEARAANSSDSLVTAGAPANIDMQVDGLHVIAQLVDENGIPVKHDEREIMFNVTGDARILGVDNGLPTSTQDFQSNRITTSQGRCLVVLSKDNGFSIAAMSPGIENTALVVNKNPLLNGHASAGELQQQAMEENVQ